MKQKSTRFWLAVIAVSLTISMGYMLLNPTTDREATAEEIANAALYALDWSTIPGWDGTMTEKEFILNLCSYAGEQTVGNNVHKTYSSDALMEYLYRCHELASITELDETLYITYYADDEDMIVLAYDDSGICETGIYDAETDTMYHEIDGNAVIWNKFRKGFQWGK